MFLYLYDRYLFIFQRFYILGIRDSIFNYFYRLISRGKLSKGEVGQRMGNCSRVATTMIGVLNLNLPCGDYLSLEKCLCIPNIFKSIILVS